MIKLPQRLLRPSLLRTIAIASRAKTYATSSSSSSSSSRVPPFKKILVANRGEIAIRVFRAGEELGLKTVGIYSHEDRFQLHRTKADESYLVGKGKSPVQAYLDYPDIIRIAQECGADAIHPGYGFLSERREFAESCKNAGIVFIGPPVSALETFGDKTKARNLAQSIGVPVIPGTEKPVTSVEEALTAAKKIGFPVMLKATMGGGGRGMRKVMAEDEFVDAFERASSEAKQAFGDGSMFIEKFVQNPRHIEVQILADQHGNITHLYERDCSIQRRHQKVVEIAPAPNMSNELRERLVTDAIKLARASKYVNAGTVEFLLDTTTGHYYFIEVNPRIQVEHTVTEQVTGKDIVQSQIRIAAGQNLHDMGLRQSEIHPSGYAIQCRVTTENPRNGFQPDNGVLNVFRTAEGMGIRLDSSGYQGGIITPHYDSMLCKVTSYCETFESAAQKLHRALVEFRVRGVQTNIPFLANVLKHDDFLSYKKVNTSFIETHPELMKFVISRDRATKLVNYLADVVINGPPTPLITKVPPGRTLPMIPNVPKEKCTTGWKYILQQKGPAGFAKAIRSHRGLLLTDTTWRDAHQSLLATRLRTYDINKISHQTSHIFHNLLSIENWGGATYDVTMRFLHECPWERLAEMRERVPNVPFQMLLRGANAVGYSNYPDNVVQRFCREAVRQGMDIFRIFDSLNYVDNMKLGMDAVGEAGGVIEAAICYSGDLTDPKKMKYTLDYYLNIARQLVDHGVHILAVKDMAGLLKPEAATILIGALRREFPDVPIHVHTHDTAGTGVASMMAAYKAGADIVDVAIDSMSGMTSQPAMGAIIHQKDLNCGIDLDGFTQLNDYWEVVRTHYAPFESTIKSGSAEVYDHEMPGGQYTNLQFQAQSLGLAAEWPAIKKAYASANRALGDIVKVTPSSKVVGDLAQFMVQNKLSEQDLVERAESLSLPGSVVEFLEGNLGQPYGGFPEPLRSRVVKSSARVMNGRPGADMEPFNFEGLQEQLTTKYGEPMSEGDLLSAAQYPKVFEDFMTSKERYGPVSVLPTPLFLSGLQVGEEVNIEIESGKTLVVQLCAKGERDKDGNVALYFQVNGQPRTIVVRDRAVAAKIVHRPKADPTRTGSVGAPMNGAVVGVRVRDNDVVAINQPLVVLSAMKMETIVKAPVAGRVKTVNVQKGDEVKAGDLLLNIL
eukprot:TRINITY_DN9477_c0_g1_i1.p1 TRINITY_DN9477_c0_g1~~TRINITY_DN9477_c0_g1_i1.p1  ORF type:complete len:1181 (+),score=239.12 TRINITY_DN9477_c0_g1_i1:42-3584(+)